MMNGFSCCAVLQRGNYLLDVLDILFTVSAARFAFFILSTKGLTVMLFTFAKGKLPLLLRHLLQVFREQHRCLDAAVYFIGIVVNPACRREKAHSRIVMNASPRRYAPAR